MSPVPPDVGKVTKSLSVVLSILLMGGALDAAPLRPLPQSTSNPKSAAKDYALIFGTVWDPDSHPVGGVPIRIRRSSEKKFRWEQVSNRTGEFAQRVPVGKQDYVIQADVKTPKGVPKPEVTVHVDDNERQDVGIHLTDQQLPKPAR
ncbi:MAG: carboxypeptidase-like regulatory domain-containing protein [Candidatus Korobacteraceae bacterium]